MTALYGDVIKQKCKLERLLLKKALALATLRSDEFACIIMKAGYMAVTAREVICVVKCTFVSVKMRLSEYCFNERPVNKIQIFS